MISTLYIQNLGSLIEKVLEIGPKNDFFNCTDYHIKWADFIQEYTKKLSINMNYSKKSFLSVFTHFKDKGYLLMITYSKFGAHFPNEKIKRIFNWDPKFTWQDGVSEAVQSIIRRKFD